MDIVVCKAFQGKSLFPRRAPTTARPLMGPDSDSRTANVAPTEGWGAGGS